MSDNHLQIIVLMEFIIVLIIIIDFSLYIKKAIKKIFRNGK